MKRYWFALVALALALPARAERFGRNERHVAVSVHAKTESVRAGSDTSLLFRFEIDRGWHTYWKNPGDSGLPAQIEILSPEGAKLSQLRWPTPERIYSGPLINFGFESEFVLLATLSMPKSQAANGGPVITRFLVKYLVCKEVCIPEKTEIALSLPSTAETPKENPYLRVVFADAETHAERAPSMPIRGHAAIDSGSLVFELERNAELESVRDAFLETKISGDAKTDPEIRVSNEKVQIRFPLKPDATTSASAAAVLVRPMKNPVRVELAIEKTALPPLGAVMKPMRSRTAAKPQDTNAIEILQMLIFAFFGGLVLNLMPCVFPVLSLKAIQMLSQPESASQKRLEAIGYSAGVIATFLVLASVLLAFRSAGTALGWGFQLQSPVFVASLAILFLLMALNLLGVFEINLPLFASPLINQTNTLASRGHPFASSVFTGVLAVLVATPCTAPFMGVALGFALAQPALLALLIFVALGLGLSMPFVALAFVPAFAKLFPKPGPWMVRLKKALSLPLFATVIWLGWVLSRQLGGPVAAIDSVSHSPSNAISAHASKRAVWDSFDARTFDEYLQSDEPVFVDFTAAWCITCQVNKKIALETEAVEKAFIENKVKLIRADWTTSDPAITRVLARFGRNGVPLYIWHDPKKKGEPEILPQILTPQMILDRVKR